MGQPNQYMFLVGRARPAPVKKVRRVRVNGELVTPEQAKEIDVWVARFARRHGVAKEDCIGWCWNQIAGGYRYTRDTLDGREPGDWLRDWPRWKKQWRADVQRHLDYLFFRYGPRYGEWPGEWVKP